MNKSKKIFIVSTLMCSVVAVNLSLSAATPNKNSMRKEERFIKMDTNKDNYIDFKEFTSISKKHNPLNIFTKFDKNKDGIITKSELSKKEHFFNKFDKNKDSKLSKEEIKSGKKGFRQNHHGFHNHKNKLSSLFTKFDKNKDNILSSEELGNKKRIIEKFDTNNDKKITKEEINSKMLNRERK